MAKTAKRVKKTKKMCEKLAKTPEFAFHLIISISY